MEACRRKKPMTANVKLPSTMRCIEVRKPGGPEALTVGERPLPTPKPGEVLIKVHGAGLNRGDTLQRMGMYPPPPGGSDIIGLEVSGVVVAHGEGVKEPAVGASVCALLTGGGYAEFTTAPASSC